MAAWMYAPNQYHRMTTVRTGPDEGRRTDTNGSAEYAVPNREHHA